MGKRLLHYLNPAGWASTLAIYGNGRLWREVWLQAARSRWAEVTAAIAFFWLLGLLGLSFVLLHLEPSQAVPLPAGAWHLAHGLSNHLAIAAADPSARFMGRWGLGLIGLMAWFCLVIGTRKLVQLVTLAQGSGPARSDWRTRLLPWGLTLLGLGLAALVFSLVGGAAPPPPLSLMQWFWRLGRWLVALVGVALGLGVLYRLAPRRWVPGLPLWSGVRLAIALGLVGLGLRQWGLAWLARQDLAYGVLLALALNLGALYVLILLVPVGAQINLSTQRHQGPTSRPWGAPPTTTTPPSFDSFKINRRD
ncbi:MAG TPA: YhjD/YihY/BrkB family envelope integrity protein [Nodosilinea sp.]|nr:YhjD/YihY/BrkB family envelope integrity protein [Nodosilinea sp.]